MDDNPFYEINGMMRSAAERSAAGRPVLLEGAVTATAPLSVACANLTLTGDALRVNAALLAHSETLSGTLGASVNCAVGSVSQITLAGSAQLTPQLTAGDRVLLLTLDYQMFYVLCKVVTT